MIQMQSVESPAIKRVVVVGGGTAGLLAALAMRQEFPTEIDITVIRSSELGVIGVGEGTIPSVVQFLHNFLGINHRDFHQQVHPSIKLGIKFVWGSRPHFNYTFAAQLTQASTWFDQPNGFYCEDDFDFVNVSAALMKNAKVWLRRPDGSAQVNGNFAYHLENRRFVHYLESLTDRPGINKIDDIISGVEQDNDGIRSVTLQSGRKVEGDFFVDCSGFNSILLGRELGVPRIDYSDRLFCDRAVTGGWDRDDEVYFPHTTTETMDAGWCWQIEHDTIINRGYVFSSPFISDEQACDEFIKKNPKVKTPRVIHFPAGRRKQFWVKNTVAIGNAAGFVEPLEATAIGMICDGILSVTRALQASNFRVLDIQRQIYNQVQEENWDLIRDFLALHYKFNDRIDTPFWRAAQNDTDIGNAQQYVDYYREVGPDFRFLVQPLKRDFFSADGYLAMLLGMKVPHQGKKNIAEEDKQKWRLLMANLDAKAKTGMPMQEYLEFARNNDIAINEMMGNRKMRAGVPASEGQLAWH